MFNTIMFQSIAKQGILWDGTLSQDTLWHLLKCWEKDRNDKCEFTPVTLDDILNSNECHVDVDYLWAVGWDFKNTRYEILSRRQADWQAAKKVFDKLQQDYFDKKNAHFQVMWNKINPQIPYNIIVLIDQFHHVIPANIKININNISKSYGMGLKTKMITCIPCTIYPNNQAKHICQITQQELDNHEKSDQHQVALNTSVIPSYALRIEQED